MCSAVCPAAECGGLGSLTGLARTEHLECMEEAVLDLTGYE